MQQELANIKVQLSDATAQLQHTTQTATHSTQMENPHGVQQLALQKKLLKAEVESLRRQVPDLQVTLKGLQQQQQQV